MFGQNLVKILRAPTTRFYRLHKDGLFGNVKIQHGNNKPKSLHKTRRIWLPNIQHVNLYSAVLEENMRIRVTTRVLRTIDKKGGLDNYLLETKDKNIGTQFGIELKQKIKNALEQKKPTEQQQQPSV
ncbi:hypothetical protein GGI25_001589 [Coemansia spiralis]|uniref:Large ribosomal subunit protein bL28m n=2 Tax=Coemansia TaxID=4863 RepID=A0A9W8GC37_9FUNG|nr:hypothetical protein BX070DRAFT_227119 [Coemansia spiralis]KAJ1993698.1 hypothetical protein EDC05_002091 [Coemansia umbellata]KAJ2622936.1 hypothetical protein GGI26_002737 [Coemansia sp. RSA 1358]KAJ2679454.1 hypothetical protein GGI25_001589 [Coemansia spiralis]